MFWKKHKVPEKDPYADWEKEREIWARKRDERHEALMKVHDQCEKQVPKI